MDCRTERNLVSTETKVLIIIGQLANVAESKPSMTKAEILAYTDMIQTILLAGGKS